jgi:hypothetical protein
MLTVKDMFKDNDLPIRPSELQVPNSGDLCSATVGSYGHGDWFRKGAERMK